MAFGGALLGAGGKTLSSKVLLKKFGPMFWEMAYSMKDAVRGWHLVPSALRGRVYTAVDAVVAGINTIFNGLSAPDLETDWGGASEE
jgi:hypothetical protein